MSSVEYEKRSELNVIIWILKLSFRKAHFWFLGANFKLDDTMEAREVDMKMRLADLQRRYKEKQKELAKIQRKNKKDKQESAASIWRYEVYYGSGWY